MVFMAKTKMAAALMVALVLARTAAVNAAMAAEPKAPARILGRNRMPKYAVRQSRMVAAAVCFR